MGLSGRDTRSSSTSAPLVSRWRMPARIFSSIFRPKPFEPALADDGVEVAGQGLQGPRPPLVGPGLERVLALDLQQEPDLPEHQRDGEPVHPPELVP